MQQAPEKRSFASCDEASQLTTPNLIETKVPYNFQTTLDKCNIALNRIKNKDNPTKNRITITLSTFNGHELLGPTLKDISHQLRSANLTGDIFVIKNNGGGSSSKFINREMSEEEIEKLKEEIGVDSIVFGHTIKATTYEPTLTPVSSSKTIQIDDESFLSNSGINLIVIDQQQSEENQGKIRAYRDLFDYLYQLNQHHSYCPEFLFTMDSETRLVSLRGKDNSESLLHMIILAKKSVTNGRKAMIGAKLKFIPYNEKGDPDQSSTTPPMQEVISIMHGQKGYEWLPGGATLGEFSDMVPILKTISQDLPGTRIEDVLTTVIAKQLGIKTIIDTDVAHLNRCPNGDEKAQALQQMIRWLSGLEGLKIIVGEKLSRTVINDNLFNIIRHPLIAKFIRAEEVSILYLLKGLLPYIKAKGNSKRDPDNFVDGRATF
ncbi:hypothetical protein B6D29_01405 [Microgenomates bacterium UTCPR1]|nr:MAG: hypothetical protein B6D29_01405 [Microgenomates bacterium UTCPR1]